MEKVLNGGPGVRVGTSKGFASSDYDRGPKP